MVEQGRKFDGGKLRYDLLPVHALEEVTRVMTLGAEKYDPENWKRVPEGRRRYTAAAFRHIEAWRKGETTDEIGTHHIANAISNLMFILEKELQGIEDVTEQSPKVSEVVADETDPLKPWVPDDSCEWVEYDGSGQPVEDYVEVEALFFEERNSKDYAPFSEYAKCWCWEKREVASDIVAYKVVK